MVLVGYFFVVKVVGMDEKYEERWKKRWRLKTKIDVLYRLL